MHFLHLVPPFTLHYIRMVKSLLHGSSTGDKGYTCSNKHDTVCISSLMQATNTFSLIPRLLRNYLGGPGSCLSLCDT